MISLFSDVVFKENSCKIHTELNTLYEKVFEDTYQELFHISKTNKTKEEYKEIAKENFLWYMRGLSETEQFTLDDKSFYVKRIINKDGETLEKKLLYDKEIEDLEDVFNKQLPILMKVAIENTIL